MWEKEKGLGGGGLVLFQSLIGIIASSSAKPESVWIDQQRPCEETVLPPTL